MAITGVLVQGLVSLSFQGLKRGQQNKRLTNWEEIEPLLGAEISDFDLKFRLPIFRLEILEIWKFKNSLTSGSKCHSLINGDCHMTNHIEMFYFQRAISF